METEIDTRKCECGECRNPEYPYVNEYLKLRYGIDTLDEMTTEMYMESLTKYEPLIIRKECLSDDFRMVAESEHLYAVDDLRVDFSEELEGDEVLELGCECGFGCENLHPHINEYMKLRYEDEYHVPDISDLFSLNMSKLVIVKSCMNEDYIILDETEHLYLVKGVE